MDFRQWGIKNRYERVHENAKKHLKENSVLRKEPHPISDNSNPASAEVHEALKDSNVQIHNQVHDDTYHAAKDAIDDLTGAGEGYSDLIQKTGDGISGGLVHVGELIQNYAKGEKTPQKRPAAEQPGPPRKQPPTQQEAPPVGGHVPAAIMEDDQMEQGASAEAEARQGGTGQMSTMISGGLRKQESYGPITNKFSHNLNITKRHNWVLKQDQSLHAPKYSTAGTQATTTLSSRWFEVPDNEMSFYLDRAELDFLENAGRYYRIKSASWQITAADVILKTTTTPGGTVPQTTIATGWQPRLLVARASNCIPPMRERYWSDLLGNRAAASDNTFNAGKIFCGVAHSGVPTYLPQIQWHLRAAKVMTSATATTAPPAEEADLLYYSNDPTQEVGHLDILNLCHAEFEMGAVVPPFIKKPYKMWRCSRRGPFNANLVQQSNNTSAPQGDNQVPHQCTYPAQPRNRSALCHRNLEGNLNYKTYRNVNAWFPTENRYEDLWSQVIGPDKYIVHQFKDSHDNYFPHLTNGIENPATFLAMNLLPRAANSVYQYEMMLTITSHIEIEMETPFHFAYNPGAFGSPTTNWSGDDRLYWMQNNTEAIGYSATNNVFLISKNQNAVMDATETLRNGFTITTLQNPYTNYPNIISDTPKDDENVQKNEF